MTPSWGLGHMPRGHSSPCMRQRIWRVERKSWRTWVACVCIWVFVVRVLCVYVCVCVCVRKGGGVGGLGPPGEGDDSSCFYRDYCSCHSSCLLRHQREIDTDREKRGE